MVEQDNVSREKLSEKNDLEELEKMINSLKEKISKLEKNNLEKKILLQQIQQYLNN